MDDTFTLYDLKVEVVATDRPMVCSHRAGDYFLHDRFPLFLNFVFSLRPLDRHHRALSMTLNPFSYSCNFKSGSTVWIRTGDLGIRKHPVIRVQWPLLCRK